MIYNYELWEKLNQIDNTIEEPASLFINGKWSVDDFIEYCVESIS